MKRSIRILLFALLRFPGLLCNPSKMWKNCRTFTAGLIQQAQKAAILKHSMEFSLYISEWDISSLHFHSSVSPEKWSQSGSQVLATLRDYSLYQHFWSSPSSIFCFLELNRFENKHLIVPL